MTSIAPGTSARPFWQRPSTGGENLAVIDGRSGESLTYAELYDRVDQAADPLGSHEHEAKKLALLRARNDLDSLLCYLALLASGHVVWLWPATRLEENDIALIRRYQPDLVVCHPSLELQLDPGEYPGKRMLCGYTMHLRDAAGGALHQDLALLLSTSGSTSSPKLARLSYSSIAANAAQIVDALEIRPEERWLASLPFHYVFGLSVINSALCAGATLVLGDKTVMQQSYWQLCKEQGVNGFAAVPSQLELMRAIKMDVPGLGAIRKIAISGGAMSEDVRHWLAQTLMPAGVRIYSMYGMTEASGRIAVLAPEEFSLHSETVGRAVHGGTLTILESGEVEYAGANVMMGYATSRAELAHEDALRGVLRTGDLGSIDAAGRLTLRGRENRLCKLFGVRIDLDDVEELCSNIAPVATVGNGNRIHVFHVDAPAEALDACVHRLLKQLRMPVGTFMVTSIDAIPRTSSGKTNYAALLRLLDA